jgi:hypothetical protein
MGRSLGSGQQRCAPRLTSGLFDNKLPTLARKGGQTDVPVYRQRRPTGSASDQTGCLASPVAAQAVRGLTRRLDASNGATMYLLTQRAEYEIAVIGGSSLDTAYVRTTGTEAEAYRHARIYQSPGTLVIVYRVRKGVREVLAAG